MIDLSRYSKLASIEIQPISIRINDIPYSELIDGMTKVKGEGVNFYQLNYGAPEGVLSIGYSSSIKGSILVGLDMGFDIEFLEDKMIEIYDWLNGDMFIKF